MYFLDYIRSTLSWKGKMTFMIGPTGTGKSTALRKKFIREQLKLYKMYGLHKVLYLGNRSILKDQIVKEIISEFGSIQVLDETITVWTYQELEMKIRSGEIKDLSEFCAVICDEVHYFLLDSTFNARGTVIPFMFIMYYGLGKSLVFTSATFDEIEGVLMEAAQRVLDLKERKSKLKFAYSLDGETIVTCKARSLLSETHILPNEVRLPEDFSTRYLYLKAHCVSNLEALAGELSNSEFKSIVFIDSRNKGSELMEKLTKECGIPHDEVCLLNRDGLNTSSSAKRVVDEIIETEKLNKKILITTSILDNGINILDPEVKNIAIITESRTSFLQMLGRVRRVNDENINLYLVIRTAEEFDYKIREYDKVISYLRKKTDKEWEENPVGDIFCISCDVWGQNDGTESFYKKIFIPLSADERRFWFWNDLSHYRDRMLYVLNPLAKREFFAVYDTLLRYKRLAKKDPMLIIEEQLSWVSKTLDDLEIVYEIDYEEEKEKLKNELISVVDFTSEDYTNIKKLISTRYIALLKKMLGITGIRDGRSITREQFTKLLSLLGLEEESREEKLSRRKLYSIKCTREDEKHEQR